MRMLARDRDDRYPTMLEVEQDLERFARRHAMVGSTLALAEFIAPVVEAAQRQAESRRHRLSAGPPGPSPAGVDAAGEKRREQRASSRGGEGRAQGQDTVAAIPWSRQRRLGSSGVGSEAAGNVAIGTRPEATALPERVTTVEPPAEITLAEPASAVTRVGPRRPPFLLLLLIMMAAGGAAAALYREAVRSHERPEPGPPDRGALWVTSQPPGAAVWISLGPAPAVSGPLDRGREQQVRVEQFGYRPRDVAIPAGGAARDSAPAEIAVELELARDSDAAPVEPAALPGAAAPAARGQIRVLSQPPAARVWLLVGVTPARIDHVSTAVRHELRVARSDTLPAFLTVEPDEFGPGGEARAWAMLSPRDPQQTRR
jgi:hypothetical protein